VTAAAFYRKIRCLDWARRAGLRTFFLAPSGPESDREVISSLADLVARV
jgi:hypothetical protein